MATIVGGMLFSVLGDGDAQAFQRRIKSIAAEGAGTEVREVPEKG